MLRPLFESYIDERFSGDPRRFFYEWDIDAMLSDGSAWSVPNRWLYMYVLANDCGFRTLHAHVGCSADFVGRLAQHNKKSPGGPPETRKAAGNWTIIMWVRFPPLRNYSTKEFKSACKRGRGWSSRCKRAVSIARSALLDWGMNRIVADPRSPYYSPALIGEIGADADAVYFDLPTQ